MHAVRIHLTTNALVALAQSMMFTTYAVYYIQMLHLNPLQLVLVGTLLEATIMLLEVPTGVVADSYSRRLSVRIGFFVIGAAYLLEGSIPWLLPGALFAGVLLAEGIRGVGETFLSGAYDAWLAGEVGEERLAEINLRTSQVSRIFGLIGMVAGIGLATLGLNLPYLVGGALFLAVGVYLLAYMPETGFEPAPRLDRRPWKVMAATFKEGLSSVRGSRLLMMVMAVSLVFGAYSEGVDRLWEAHFLTTFGLPQLGRLTTLAWFGIINVAGTLAGLVVTRLVQDRLNLTTHQEMSSALFVLTALRVLFLVAFALSGSFAWALVSFLAFGATGGLLYPIYNAWVNQSIDPQVRATVLSMLSLNNAFGQTAGGPLVGGAGARFSLRSALVLSALLLSPSLLVFARTRRT